MTIQTRQRETTSPNSAWATQEGERPRAQAFTKPSAIREAGAATVEQFACSLTATPLQLARLDSALQFFRDTINDRPDVQDVSAIATEPMRGSGSSLPHLDRIQQAFGHHDVSGVQAYVGKDADAATRSLGARAYATHGAVVLGDAGTDLHTVAHEAAHVVQQRGGVQLTGNVGTPGDRYERHADAVADAVVENRSAESLLDEFSTGGAPSAQGAKPVQRKVKAGVSFDEDNNLSMGHKLSLPIPSLYAGLIPSPTPPMTQAPPGVFLALSGGFSLGQASGAKEEKGGYVELSLGSDITLSLLAGAKVQDAGLYFGGAAQLGAKGAVKYYPSTGKLEISSVHAGKVKAVAKAGPLSVSKTFATYELLKVGGTLETADGLSLEDTVFELGEDVGKLGEDLLLLVSMLGTPMGLAAALTEAGWEFAMDALEAYLLAPIQIADALGTAVTAGAEVTEEVVHGIAEVVSEAVWTECAYEFGFYRECLLGVIGDITAPSDDAANGLRAVNKAAMKRIKAVMRGEAMNGKPQAVTTLDVPLSQLVGHDLTLPLTQALMASNPDVTDIGEITYRELIIIGSASGWFTLRRDAHAAGVAFEDYALARYRDGESSGAQQE